MTDDTTTARRDLLGILLSRAERGTLTTTDRQLLRPLVEAEMATLDELEAHTHHADRLTRLCLLRDAHERAVRLSAEWRQSDDPSLSKAGYELEFALGLRDVTPEAPATVRCSPLVNPDCLGHTGADRCERAASSPVVMAATPDWEHQDAELDRRQDLLDAQYRHEANQTGPTQEPTQ